MASPVTITGKVIFSEVCARKLKWDESLPNDIMKRWDKWIKNLQQRHVVTVPRCVVGLHTRVMSLYGFSDASGQAVCAAIYITSVCQDGTTVQNLLVAKSRIAQKNTSIPRLELVAALTLAKLINHIFGTLRAFKLAECHLWTDSMTVLYWLANKGKWSQYIRNRVRKIHELTTADWHYVPTAENPSDLATREIVLGKVNELWLKGPPWLTSVADWPEQPEITETKEARTEHIPKERALLEVDRERDVQHEWQATMLQKYAYWKLLRVTAYIRRFIDYCQKKKENIGPLTAEEINLAERTWVRIAQEGCEQRNDVPIEKDEVGIWRWHGRVTGYNPIFLPRQHQLAELVVKRYHRINLHGGVQSTMNHVRERFWIPRLRRLTQKVRSSCNHCKKFRAQPLPSPASSKLPPYRTRFVDAFAATGVDFAGPLYYKNCRKINPKKAYVILFTCASTRAVHLKLCREMTATEFQRALNEFIARRGVPQLIVSDNAKTFYNTKKWIDGLRVDHELNNYLATQSIKWQFNLSRAPWWGGFFERLVGVMKSCLSKVMGKALLTYTELEETLLDVECFMNNRPLCYVSE